MGDKEDKRDLTVSKVDHQNILNNAYALQEIEKTTRIKGIPFEGKTVVLKEQVAKFFEITLRTVENYLGEYSDELAQNGYEIIKGNRLKALKMSILEMDVPETDFGNISKSPQLGKAELKQRIEKYLDEVNAAPVVFKWKYNPSKHLLNYIDN